MPTDRITCPLCQGESTVEVKLNKLEIITVNLSELCRHFDFIDDNLTDAWSYGDAHHTLIPPIEFHHRVQEFFGVGSEEDKAMAQAIHAADFIDLEH